MASLTPLTEKPETLTAAVYERIHQAIVTRALPPGARLTEAGLAAELRVSKTPVREAFLRLREIGLIEPDPTRGNRVAAPTSEAQRDAYELRRVLETFSARMAAARATEQQVDALQAIARRSMKAAQTRSFSAFREPDHAFHRLIAEAAGNRSIARTTENVSALIRALRQRDQPDAEAAVGFGEAHLRIADAIARRDGDAAASEMWGHLLHAEQLFVGDPVSA